MNRLWVFLLAALLFCGCADDTLGGHGGYEGDADTQPNRIDGDETDEGELANKPEDDDASLHQAEPWAITVVGTDYFSSSISIIERESRTLFRENVIHSGSSDSGLSIALSGDVVFPQHHNPNNWIVLLDRYPNSVLTFIDPYDFNVIGQLSVATGFASNPHDFLWISKHKAYVTRYETNPSPSEAPFDSGDDILIVDPTALDIIGHIPLAEFADIEQHERIRTHPDKMAYGAGLVWVSADHLSSDFKHAGDGLVIGIDPTTDEVVEVLRLEGVTNCTGIAYAKGEEALFVSCSGLFLEGQELQIEKSSIVKIDLSGEAVQVSHFAKAKEGSGRPFGFTLDILNDRWLIAARFGDLEEGIHDQAVAFDIETGEERLLHESSSPFGLGGILADDGTNTVYIGDADAATPGVHLYRLENGLFQFDGVIDSHPNLGMPPRHIRFY